MGFGGVGWGGGKELLLEDCTLTWNGLDHLIERNNRVLALDVAVLRDITSTRNYVQSGDLARGETAYLEDERDLFYVAGARCNKLRRLQPLMEALTRRLCKVFGKVVSQLCEFHSESDSCIKYIL